MKPKKYGSGGSNKVTKIKKGADPLNLAGPKKNKNKKAGIDGPSKTSKKKDFSDFGTKAKRKSRSVKKPVRVANVDDFKEAPKLDKRKAGAEKMLKTVKMAANNPRGVGGPVPKKIKKFAGGGSNSFPDLTGDGKTTKADILKGRGVPGFSRGGGMAIQGLGFKGVR